MNNHVRSARALDGVGRDDHLVRQTLNVGVRDFPARLCVAIMSWTHPPLNSNNHVKPKMVRLKLKGKMTSSMGRPSYSSLPLTLPMSHKNSKIKVGISCGDPNGIGLEALADALADERCFTGMVPVVFAPRALAEAAFDNVQWGEVEDADSAKQGQPTWSRSRQKILSALQGKLRKKLVPWPCRVCRWRWITSPKPQSTCSSQRPSTKTPFAKLGFHSQDTRNTSPMRPVWRTF